MDTNELLALEIMARLPDETPLRVEEAALFLRISASSLNKMRMPMYPATGPAYSQAGRRGATGSNQRVVYMKRDLIAWLDQNRLHDTLEAAVRKGQL